MELSCDEVVFQGDGQAIAPGKWEYLHRADAPVTVLAAGERCLTVAMKVLESLKTDGKQFSVVNARFVKPLDEELLRHLNGTVITLEDNVAIGGFGSLVNGFVSENGLNCKVKCFAYKDEFIPQGSVAQLQREYGVNCDEIRAFILENL